MLLNKPRYAKYGTTRRVTYSLATAIQSSSELILTQMDNKFLLLRNPLVHRRVHKTVTGSYHVLVQCAHLNALFLWYNPPTHAKHLHGSRLPVRSSDM